MARLLLRPLLGVVATTAALILAAPSALAAPGAADPVLADDDAVSIAVVGEGSLIDGRELGVADLVNEHGVDPDLVQAFGQGTGPAEPDPR